MEKLLHERLREYVDDSYRVSFKTDKKQIVGLTSLDAEALIDEIERFYIPRPRFEDGEPVQFGDEPDLLETIDEISFFADGSVTIGHDGNTFEVNGFVKRPTPKVLDADGVEIKVGDTVYSIHSNHHFTVMSIEECDGKTLVMETFDIGTEPDALTHERTVFDANGERICKGDTVWTTGGLKGTVVKITYDGKVLVDFGIARGINYGICTEEPDSLTHSEPDSIQKAVNDLGELLNFPMCDDVKLDKVEDIHSRLTALIERGNQ